MMVQLDVRHSVRASGSPLVSSTHLDIGTPGTTQCCARVGLSGSRMPRMSGQLCAPPASPALTIQGVPKRSTHMPKPSAQKVLP